MMHARLTRTASLAKSPRMRGTRADSNGSGRRAVRAAMVVAGLIPMLGGCINVSAPDKPIVIELNINIRQEVIYKLAADAANTIQENKDIF